MQRKKREERVGVREREHEHVGEKEHRNAATHP